MSDPDHIFLPEFWQLAERMQNRVESLKVVDFYLP
jgi:hypothetical protein